MIGGESTGFSKKAVPYHSRTAEAFSPFMIERKYRRRQKGGLLQAEDRDNTSKADLDPTE